jgi:type VI secretion system secreted protein VgrG
VLTYSGLSKIPLQIGGTLSVLKDGIEGEFIATRVQHYSKGFGHYECQFEAIPRDVKVPPYTNPLLYPKAETQGAVVTDNNDPSGMGRIKVKFFWNHESDWTRLVTPHAGSGKGFYFIPEVGEEVFVSFEGGNPEKPFVIGTQYNGQEISGYNTAGNDQKVIHTRSGTKMIFNDAQGSIFIEDPSGNTWLMDGQGNISVNAPKNFTLTAGDDVLINAGKNISINAGENISNSANENISSVAGTDIIQTATGDIKESSDNRTELVESNFKRQAAISDEIAGEVSIFSEKENMTMQSGKTVEFNSAEKSKMF